MCVVYYVVFITVFCRVNAQAERQFLNGTGFLEREEFQTVCKLLGNT